MGALQNIIFLNILVSDMLVACGENDELSYNTIPGIDIESLVKMVAFLTRNNQKS